MKRYILAATAALTTLTAGVAFTDVDPALAHHLVIVGEPSCATAAGDYTVPWTLRADAVRGLTWTIDGVTKPDSAAFTYTTAHNLSGPAPSLTKTATWSNGITSTVTGTVAKPGLCPAVTTTVPAPTTTIPPTTTIGVPPSTIPTTSGPAPSTTAPNAPSGPTEPSTSPTTTTAPTVTSSVDIGLPPLPSTSTSAPVAPEGDATSQAPGPPPVPPSGLPKTGLKRDTARLALGLCLVGFVLVGVRRVRRT